MVRGNRDNNGITAKKPKTEVFSCRLPSDHPIFKMSSKERKQTMLNLFNENTSEPMLQMIIEKLTELSKEIKVIKEAMGTAKKPVDVSTDVPAYDDVRLENATENFINI